MLYNIKPILLHRVFHGIRFKVNKDWVSGIDTLLFYIPLRRKKINDFYCFYLQFALPL